MRSRTSRYRLYFIAVGFALFLAVSLIAGLKLGYLEISWQQLLACLADFPTSWQSNEPLDDTILNLRMPRVVLAAAVGMGLAVCGVVMQAILANPLADPYILGVSSGASLGAAVAIFFGAGALFGAQSIGIFAAAGAFFISLLVLLLVSAGKGNMSTRLLLAGMAFHAVCSSITSFIVFVGGNREGMQSFSFWLLGNVANTKWENVSVLLMIVVLLSMFFLTQSRRLNLLLLGEEDAVVLGLDAKHWRLVLLAVEALLDRFHCLQCEDCWLRGAHCAAYKPCIFWGRSLGHVADVRAFGRHRRCLGGYSGTHAFYRRGSTVRRYACIAGGTVFPLFGSSSFLWIWERVSPWKFV